jgi:plasmid stabilization system protein ParE
MARRLIWSLRARLDLKEVIDFIAQDGPVNAASVGRRIVGRVRSLPD